MGAISVSVVVAAIVIAGCATSVRYSQYTYRSDLSALQRQLLEVATSYIGMPYCKGGSRERCFDCSGFVQAVFAQVGIYLPRTTLQQSYTGRTISTDQLQVGDLVFFRFGSGKGSAHVGIYAGDGTIFHASESRGVIREQLWGTYLERRIVQFRRVLTDTSSRR